MESVWWVFKQIYDKGLIYRGFKVMPYSTACSTPLANFEATLNYKDVKVHLSEFFVIFFVLCAFLIAGPDCFSL